MLKRTITAIVAIAVFFPFLYFSDTFMLPLAISILGLAAAYEMVGCVGLRNNVWIAVPSYLTAIVLPQLVRISENPLPLVFAVCIVYMICVFAATVFSRGKLDYTIASSAFTGVFYVTVAFTSIVFLRDIGKYFYLLVFVGPWSSDTFAYICGRLFGKHKLIPEVSPKKTVEGSIGGIVFAGISYVIYSLIIKNFFDSSVMPNYLVMMLAGAIVSVISQIGDLIASVIKRRFGIKDYGWVFPGHGGVLDRFDSVLLTAPVLYILSQIPAFSGILL
ncbi:MAG: CDP-archaeol synthase [Clostridia bacterium]|nr:CDP-archaeol synthase [Clostridia bacterium]